jgi:hypothetical protein
VCGPAAEGEGPEDKDFARFFVSLQLVGGFSFVDSGMIADRKPPLEEIIDGEFLDINGDGRVVMNLAGEDTNMDGTPDAMTDAFDRNGDGFADDLDGDTFPDNRYYFDDQSAWVPDADSFDDYEDASFGIPRGTTPVSVNCAGDGKATGPLDLPNEGFTTIEPSSYCVRVQSPGLVPNLALRFTPGYFLSKSFALSLPIRFQFNSGEGTFSNLLIGLRGELLFSEMDSATGVPISWFFGATYGQIQAKPPPKDPARDAPFITSGPIGLHTGINLRIRVHRNFGFIIGPEVDVLLPKLLLHGDLSGGFEAAF